MGVAKYFVWGDGIWRELDVASGRVTGWRNRARFVFVRRGRLQVARRRAVLRALQALSDGQPSNAADGPRLSRRRKSDVGTKSGVSEKQPTTAGTTTCAHHHCCAHVNGFNHNMFKELPWPIAAATPAPLLHQRSEASTQCAAKVDAGTSTERSQAFTIKPKIIRNDSSGEDFVTPKSTKPSPKLTSTRRADINALLGKQKSATAPIKTEKTPVAGASNVSSRAVEDHSEIRRPTRPAPKSRAPTTSSDDQTIDRKIAAKSNSRKREAPEDDRSVCKELIISEADVAALRGFVARTRASALARFDADQQYRCSLFYAINPLVEIERCEPLERACRQRRAHALERFAARLGLARGGAPAGGGASRAGGGASRAGGGASRAGGGAAPARTKRRRAAARHRQRSSSADTNKENLEDEHLSTKYRSEQKTKKVTEPELAGTELRQTRARGQLGESERSNKEDTIRKLETKAEAPRISTEASRSKQSIAVIEKGDRREKEARVVVRRGQKELAGDGGGKAASVVEQSEDETLAALATAETPNGVLAGLTHVISKRAFASGAKEYSNLEDHAIVAWVSSGARASQVNGNRLWKDLEEQYGRLTGQSRSWHSLRNRYLRYILPALGALRLPLATASRLRAAAATGSIKSKQRPGSAPRRNSIFDATPVASAAARLARLRPPPTPTPTPAPTADKPRSPPTPTAGSTTNESKNAPPARRSLRGRDVAGRDAAGRDVAGSDGGAPRRSPRYSDVTRRFASRHRPSPHTSSPSSPSPEPPSLRTRRLYNPNTNI